MADPKPATAAVTPQPPVPTRRTQIEDIVIAQSFQWAPSQFKATPQMLAKWITDVVDALVPK